MAANTELDQVRADLELSVDRLNASFVAAHAQFDLIAQTVSELPMELSTAWGPRLNDRAMAFEQRLDQCRDQWSQRIGAELSGHAVAIAGAAESLREHLETEETQVLSAYQAVQQAVSHLSEVLTTAEQAVSDSNEAGQAAVTALQQQWSELQGDLDELLSEFHSEVAEQEHATMEEATKAFDGLVTKYRDDIGPSTFESVASELSGIDQQFDSLVHQASQELNQDLEELLADLQGYVRDSAQSKVEERFQRLVKETVHAVEHEIVEAVVKTTVGVEITGAISPILPELIVLHKVVDAIRGAIEAFKALKALV